MTEIKSTVIKSIIENVPKIQSLSFSSLEVNVDICTFENKNTWKEIGNMKSVETLSLIAGECGVTQPTEKPKERT